MNFWPYVTLLLCLWIESCWNISFLSPWNWCLASCSLYCIHTYDYEASKVLNKNVWHVASCNKNPLVLCLVGKGGAGMNCFVGVLLWFCLACVLYLVLGKNPNKNYHVLINETLHFAWKSPLLLLFPICPHKKYLELWDREKTLGFVIPTDSCGGDSAVTDVFILSPFKYTHSLSHLLVFQSAIHLLLILWGNLGWLRHSWSYGKLYQAQPAEKHPISLGPF